jgi:hypothetical protein
MYLFHKSSSLDGSIGINLISGPVAPTLPTLYFHDDPASQRLIPLPCLSWDGLLQEGRVRSASVDGRPRLGQSKSSPALRPGPLDPRVVRVRSLAIKLKFLFASEAEIFTAVLSNRAARRTVSYGCTAVLYGCRSRTVGAPKQGGVQKKIYDTGSDFFLTTS